MSRERKREWKLGNLQLMRRTLQLLVSPRWFAARASDWDFSTELETNPQLPEDRRGQFRDAATARARKVRRSIAGTLLTVLGITLSGYIIGRIVHWIVSPAAELFLYMRVTSAFLVAWGVLGRLGWEIQSIKGRTVAEQINSWWFRALYCLGLLIGVASLAAEG